MPNEGGSDTGEKELRADEEELRRSHTILLVDDVHGKNGDLLLTDRRLIWKPVRLPFPRLEAQEIGLEEIEDCRVGGRRFAVMTFGIPLIVKAQEHEFQFFFAGDPIDTILKPRIQEEWRNAILAARDALTE